ncbi:hypothetical protein EJ04DRAFT_563923 [Polyplosphaeria fusca]|uniref:Uncharacterized protein n=1 Tax=Polyplosphaeria fusca TaxID=682080 RepID=A0A9P4R1I3_9PLEO|nr:hypothetical protein EJ04DRAFT_563923 [Polyplosphaeria fusca]
MPPVRPPAGRTSRYSTQDAHSDLAPQRAATPAATPPKFKIKKSAVKMVGLKSAVEPTATRAPAPSPNVNAPVATEPKGSEISESLKPASSVAPPIPTRPDLHHAHSSKNAVADSLAALYADLTAKSTNPEPVATPQVKQATKAAESVSSTTSPSSNTVPVTNGSPEVSKAEPQKPKAQNREEADLEYIAAASVALRKAAQVYLAFADACDACVRGELVQLDSLEIPSVPDLNPFEWNDASLEADPAKQYLVEVINDFIKTRAHCDIMDMRNAIRVSVLSRNQHADKTTTKASNTDDTATSWTESAIQSFKAGGSFVDPMENATAWPSQEKRESTPGCRTVLLKGVLGLTIHEVQALVWGGRIAEIKLDTNKGSAMVKFLTAEGCQKYFSSTANGIAATFKSGKKIVVFVESLGIPTSVNDVLKNCAESNASRCILVADVDEDWILEGLEKLARGLGRAKRDVDIVKQFKRNSRNFVEFRFADIVQALSFKRLLQAEEEFEHCQITFGKDPCETANGVHIEEGGSSA